MKTIPIYLIEIPVYRFKEPRQLSGVMHYTEFGSAIPIEYWASKPNISAISQDIIQKLRSLYLGQRIGFRLLSSMEHTSDSEDLLTGGN